MFVQPQSHLSEICGFRKNRNILPRLSLYLPKIPLCLMNLKDKRCAYEKLITELQSAACRIRDHTMLLPASLPPGTGKHAVL